MSKAQSDVNSAISPTVITDRDEEGHVKVHSDMLHLYEELDRKVDELLNLTADPDLHMRLVTTARRLPRLFEGLYFDGYGTDDLEAVVVSDKVVEYD